MIEERKQEVRSKVYEDLSLPDESKKFEKYVQRKNFSNEKDLFDLESFKLKSGKNPGR
jgi:hypothetical protein